jgi:methionyl aminopeptidase
MVILKSPEEMDAIRPAGKLAAEILTRLGEVIQPGVTLKELDQLAASYIKDAGAEPTYLNYSQLPNQPPFPGVITASLNDEVCHGFPDRRVLKEGDIVCIDIGLRLDGWCGDTCRTWGVGKITPEAQTLIDVTHQSLQAGIKAVRPGGHLGDIGAAIQEVVEQHGFSIVRPFGGHGIGRKPHEEPFVPHYGRAGTGMPIRPGMVFTIEPMINAGSSGVRIKDDGWTAYTSDGSLSAQFEHMLAVREDQVEILTLP